MCEGEMNTVVQSEHGYWYLIAEGGDLWCTDAFTSVDAAIQYLVDVINYYDQEARAYEAERRALIHAQALSRVGVAI